MASEQIATVRRALSLWSEGDLEGFLAILDPEIEWRTSGLYLGMDPIYRGRDGFRKFWRDFHDLWQRISMELREAVEEGDRLAFSFRFDAIGRDGVRAARDQACVVTVRDGLLVRNENYASWEEALDALRSGRERATAEASP